jgi:glycosyltransferase involved in cell wall biosynthesis
MKPEAADMVWKLMSKKAEDVEKFISVSNFYAEVMQEKMHLPKEKIATVHIGLYPEDYEFMLPSQKGRNIGYVSRMCEENGFHVLVDAYIALKKKEGFEDVKLIVTGGQTGDDKKFLAEQKRKLKEAGVYDMVEFHEDFEEEGLREYLKKVSVISVPVLNGEAFGIYLLEAMASGIPVVQPRLGAFPEIIEASKGGVIYEPNEPAVLAEQLGALLSGKEKLDDMAKQARKGVEEHFHVEGHVAKMIEEYRVMKIE